MSERQQSDDRAARLLLAVTGQQCFDKVTKQYRGKLQTEIEDMNLPNPVIRSHYRNGSSSA
jgi:hypothetical protein